MKVVGDEPIGATGSDFVHEDDFSDGLLALEAAWPRTSSLISKCNGEGLLR